MAVSRTLLRATGATGLSPKACMSRVNDVLFAESLPSMFVTCFYGVLDTRTGVIEYTNAGHNPPYVLHADGRVTPTEPVGGFFLGAFGGVPYESTLLQLQPGDSLVLFTDGISEAVNPAEDQYGEPRLEACLATLAGSSAEDIVRGVVADVEAFSAGAPQADDMTVLVLTHRPSVA
jgi:sigma-B regulation protein RsbU (phosphoserine phosphatase)